MSEDEVIAVIASLESKGDEARKAGKTVIAACFTIAAHEVAIALRNSKAKRAQA